MKSPSELRKCSKCKKHKPTGEFYTAGLNRLSSCCKPCQNEAERNRRDALRQDALRKNEAAQVRLLEILQRHGAMPCPKLAAVAGLSARHVGQAMKPLTRLGHAVLVRSWGRDGLSLYALPGHPIPKRLPKDAALDPSIRAAVESEMAAWFASLASSVAERAARNVMRGRV